MFPFYLTLTTWTTYRSHRQSFRLNGQDHYTIFNLPNLGHQQHSGQ